MLDILTHNMKLPRTLIARKAVVLSQDQQHRVAALARIRDMGLGSVGAWGMHEASVPREEALAELDRRFQRVEHILVMSMLKQLLKEHIEKLYDGCERAQG